MSTAKQPIVGNVVTFTVTFLQGTPQVPTDPGGAVTIEVKDPTGVRTSYTGLQLTHVGPGIYSVDVPVDIPGRWNGRGFSASGLGKAADECPVDVGPSSVL